MTLSTIIIAVTVAAVTFLLTHFVEKSKRAEKFADYESRLAAKSAELAASEQMRLQEKELHSRSIEEIKAAQSSIIEATKKELTLENDRILRQREEEIRKRAEETMKTITGGLDKDIREMKEAFESQKKTSAEESSSIKTKFEETVRHLREQTEAIGTQAVDLANALKGQNKMQGNFGETILENILQAEGLRKGHDYESEYWLKDSSGNIIVNEETNKKMRPDFVLHFPDQTDVLIDSKVSLTALSDYFKAQTEEERKDAARRNLKSVNDHIKELTDKEYQKFVKGRKTLDYVIMFIPNYGAYQLAKQEDPDIFAKAFRQNILITTEETLIPFLRLIRSAWVQKEQMENISEIMGAAQKMLDMVAAFCKDQAHAEKSLENTLEELRKNGRRLTEGKRSIVGAARELLDKKVPLSPGKEIPEISE